jgi:hypothetical protein
VTRGPESQKYFCAEATAATAGAGAGLDLNPHKRSLAAPRNARRSAPLSDYRISPYDPNRVLQKMRLEILIAIDIITSKIATAIINHRGKRAAAGTST